MSCWRDSSNPVLVWTGLLSRATTALVLAQALATLDSCTPAAQQAGPTTPTSTAPTSTTPAQSAGRPEEQLIRTLQQSNEGGAGRITLVNEQNRQLIPTTLIATAPPEIQARRIVYFFYGYPPNARDTSNPTSTLVLAFREQPTARTYYSSPDNTDLQVGFCLGSNFLEGDPDTGWSDVGHGHATVRFTRREGDILVGTLEARLDTNNGQHFYRLDDGQIFLRVTDLRPPAQPAAPPQTSGTSAETCQALAGLLQTCYDSVRLNHRSCSETEVMARRNYESRGLSASNVTWLAQFCGLICSQAGQGRTWEAVRTDIVDACLNPQPGN